MVSLGSFRYELDAETLIFRCLVQAISIDDFCTRKCYSTRNDWTSYKLEAGLALAKHSVARLVTCVVNAFIGSQFSRQCLIGLRATESEWFLRGRRVFF